MKKHIAILVAAMLMLSCFSGCQSSGTENTDPAFLVDQVTTTGAPTTEATETTAPTETTAAVESGLLPVGEGGRAFFFASGTGAWRTELTLHADGSFAGQFTDTNMGENTEDHPEGTVYISDFLGAFRNITQLNDHTYSMTLWYVQTLELPGEEWIQNGVRYVASEPYGIAEGTEFILYLPETPLAGLSQDFLTWWPYRFEDEARTALGCYGLENKKDGYGFFSED